MRTPMYMEIRCTQVGEEATYTGQTQKWKEKATQEKMA